jgi:RNA polymerase sigma-70 factor (ECF subfamily)
MGAHDSPSTSPTLLALLRGPGNDAAWDRFVGLYRPLVEGRCRAAGLQPADADDVTGRVLTKLVAAFRSFEYDPARRFRGYLRAVVASALADFWAERRKHPGAVGSGDPAQAEVLAHLPDPLRGLADELDDRVHDDLARARRLIDRVQAQVSAAHWRAYWLTAVEHRPAAAVAADLGLTVAAVYMAKSRVGKLLRESAHDNG